MQTDSTNLGIVGILLRNVHFVKKQIPNDIAEFFEDASCGKCHVCKMVEVFREVRRILRDDGTLWLNYGDSYAGSGGAGGDYAEGGLKEGQPKYQGTVKSFRRDKAEVCPPTKTAAGLKPKDLCGIPWRVALALQADGWWLRQDIIWHKSNPMPESVTDRCTKSHEYLFLLAKSAHYYFDAEAIREEQCESTLKHAPRMAIGKKGLAPGVNGGQVSGSKTDVGGRNRRSVWTIATEPCKEAHFATFPRKLVEPCIRAGTSEKGCCPKCGKPWERITDNPKCPTEDTRTPGQHTPTSSTKMSGAKTQQWLNEHPKTTLGWQPGCECGLEPVPCTVFDPFSGISTTGIVALPLGRDYIGIELNPIYVELAKKRIQNECGLICQEIKT